MFKWKFAFGVGFVRYFKFCDLRAVATNPRNNIHISQLVSHHTILEYFSVFIQKLSIVALDIFISIYSNLNTIFTIVLTTPKNN